MPTRIRKHVQPRKPFTPVTTFLILINIKIFHLISKSSLNGLLFCLLTTGMNTAHLYILDMTGDQTSSGINGCILCTLPPSTKCTMIGDITGVTYVV